jgi:hypothetical protein
MEIEFEIIEHQKLDGVATYAKVIKWNGIAHNGWVYEKVCLVEFSN